MALLKMTYEFLWKLLTVLVFSALWLKTKNAEVAH